MTYSNSSLSRLSRAVERLEARDWVRRTPDLDDGRYTPATVTTQGQQKVDQAALGYVDLVNQLVFDPLTRTQARQLRNISRHIMVAIRSDDGWQPSSNADAKVATDQRGPSARNATLGRWAPGP